MKVKLADLRRMSEEEREKVLSALVAEARKPRPPGEKSPIARRVKAYEAQYGMTTAELRRRLDAGEVSETAEIASWLCAALAAGE